MSFWSDDVVKYCYGGVAILAFQIVLWIASVALTNASIVDIWWGMLFLLQSIIYYSLSKELVWHNLVILILVGIHAFRLSLFIGIRNTGHGEDKRYVAMRDKIGANFWWISFFTVFLLQGVIAWIVGMAYFSSIFYSTEYQPVIYWIAIAITLSGTLIEAIADQQLYYFKKNPENRGKVLDSGLWYTSRHPNYFGEVVHIWGVYLFSIANYSYWTFGSMIVMTSLILWVSGVALTEQGMKKERGEEYQRYLDSTSSFIPWFKKSLD